VLPYKVLTLLYCISKTVLSYSTTIQILLDESWSCHYEVLRFDNTLLELYCTAARLGH
jgi:hypothetical protein